MSGKIEISRELLERTFWELDAGTPSIATLAELTVLLAAPVVERQDGSALMKIAADLANRHPLRQLYLVCEHQGRINTDSLHEHLDKCGDLLAGVALDIRRAITSPPAPVADDLVRLLTRARIYARGEFRDEIDACLAGKTAPVVAAEQTPYQPKGEWSFERCEDGAIVIKNGKDWTVIKSGEGPIYEQFLYRFCEQQIKELTAPTINENSEFEKWRSTQIDVLVRNGYPEGAEAFRNLGSVQWAGWQARACLDKVKELNQ